MKKKQTPPSLFEFVETERYAGEGGAPFFKDMKRPLNIRMEKTKETNRWILEFLLWNTRPHVKPPKHQG